MFREDAEYINRKLFESDEMAKTAFKMAEVAGNMLGSPTVSEHDLRHSESIIARSNALLARAMVAHGRASLVCMMETTNRGSGPAKPWIDVLNINENKENA